MRAKSRHHERKPVLEHPIRAAVDSRGRDLLRGLVFSVRPGAVSAQHDLGHGRRSRRLAAVRSGRHELLSLRTPGAPVASVFRCALLARVQVRDAFLRLRPDRLCRLQNVDRDVVTRSGTRLSHRTTAPVAAALFGNAPSVYGIMPSAARAGPTAQPAAAISIAKSIDLISSPSCL